MVQVQALVVMWPQFIKSWHGLTVSVSVWPGVRTELNYKPEPNIFTSTLHFFFHFYSCVTLLLIQDDEFNNNIVLFLYLTLSSTFYLKFKQHFIFLYLRTKQPKVTHRLMIKDDNTKLKTYFYHFSLLDIGHNVYSTTLLGGAHLCKLEISLALAGS